MNWKRIFAVLIVVFIALSSSGYAYLQHPKFGALPSDSQLEMSPNYANGEFQNLEPGSLRPPSDAPEKGWLDFLFSSDADKTPPGPVPAESTDLHGLNRSEDVVVWLGHSSYYIQLSGKRILVDPVLSSNASPIPMTNEAFDGANPFEPEDIPDIDYLLISHDHWDHLDYPTLKELQGRIDQVVVGIGVGEHLRKWGFREDKVHEADWNTTLRLDDELAIHVLPARHYSGRGLERNQSLWVSYALVTEERKIYFSGDSGYGGHFKSIGDAFGGFDLALLDSGQYDERWRYVHMNPEDAATAADDLSARALMPAHVGKFSIAYHSWDDPFRRLVEASAGKRWQLVTPQIGQPVGMEELNVAQTPWWLALQAAE